MRKVLQLFGMYVSLCIMYSVYLARALLRLITWKKCAPSAARLIMLRGDEILLVRHTVAPWVWTIPGGAMHAEEDPKTAAARESYEETGLVVRDINGCVGRYAHAGWGTYTTTHLFYTTQFDGTLHDSPDREIRERRFFNVGALPIALAPAHRRRIQSFVTGVREEQGLW